MKKGSITVFLSLILVLIFSFLLTTLEGARIRGATAYASMIADLAGDSFLAGYYYPLFENYRIFGVDAGNEKAFFSQNELEEGIQENLAFGLLRTSGGLLRFGETEVTCLQYENLLENDGEAFYSQIKQQAVLDGLSFGLNKLFHEEQFMEAGVVGEIYREQEEVLAVTATVTEELLKLMELTDGICMGSNGIAFDKKGRLQAEEHFIKQPVCMTQSELQELYDNEEVYNAISSSFYRADIVAEQIAEELLKVERLESWISIAEYNMWDYNQQIEELEEEYNAEKKRLEEEKDTDKTRLLELQKQIKENKALVTEEKKCKKRI